MAAEDNKLISRRLLEKLWNEKDKYIIDELTSDDYVEYTTSPYPGDPELRGPDFFKQVATAIQDIFFSIHVTIKDQVAEDDRVATHVIWECTLKDDNDPTVASQVVSLRGIGIDRIEDGKIVENWNTLRAVYGLISLMSLADPFLDPDAPIPDPPACGPNKQCKFGRACVGGKCV